MLPLFAHSKTDHTGEYLPLSEWEPMFTESCFEEGVGYCKYCIEAHPHHGHLNKVARLSGDFAASMYVANSEISKTARQWGELAGWWHDIGKFAPLWQEYLRSRADAHTAEVGEKIDHATAGAQQAVLAHSILGHLLAYGIAGHHSGLLNASSDAPGTQQGRLSKKLHYNAADAPEVLRNLPVPALPNFIGQALAQNNAFTVSFFTRLLFSCLVDADFLATESFMSPECFVQRNDNSTDVLAEIEALLLKRIGDFGKPAPDNVVSVMRARVLDDCQQSASEPQGIFTLTVPTGGGKTLSSLAFALRHAIKHGQKRIIYVVPFTSIIEQNAEVIRQIVEPLESDSFVALVEHHSALATEKETDTSRLATENWDAPIIITTAVQFYESLFAAKTSRTRKIHNIANAVVILDEAQTLPVDFLAPCLRVLQELADHYNTTSVLCTATQPAIQHDANQFPIGLREPREIIRDTAALFEALKRIELHKRGPLLDDALIGCLEEEEQVLCIVNRRRHAQKLYQRLSQGSENFHLSALMCPEHRSQKLKKVYKRLDEGLPVRLISTQLIEAGVDIDFPVVYRALAGLDSIAQAAGRCNRNGALGALGQVHVFSPKSGDEQERRAESYFSETAQVTNQLLELHNDLLGEDAIRHYFDLYYYNQKNRWDSRHILGKENMRLEAGDRAFPFVFNFKTIAEEFKLIEEWQQPVIVPYEEKAKALISVLRNEHVPLSRRLLRGLQRYTVQISPKLLHANWNSFEHPRDGQFHVLISKELNYSDDLGLILDDDHASSVRCIV